MGGILREHTFPDPCTTNCLDVITSTLCSNLAGLLPSQWDRDLPPVPGLLESFPDQQQEHPLQQQCQFQPEPWQQEWTLPEQPKESATVVCGFSDKAMGPRATLKLAQTASLCIACGM